MMLQKNTLSQLQALKEEIKANKVVLRGTVKGTQGRYGFVVTDKNQQYFLPPQEMNRVFPGDVIDFSLGKDDKGKEYAVVENLVTKILDEFIGVYVVKGNAHCCDPDIPGLNRWIFIPPQFRKGCKEGDFIRCKLSRHPIKDGRAQCEILERVGHKDDVGIAAKYVVAKYQMPYDFPEQVLSAVEEITEEKIEEIAAERTDLTNLPFVTIDALSTQDMDDALFAESTVDGWQLYVAIADPDALIDDQGVIAKEAMRRATSTYFPHEVVPMMPPQLSNEICSLVPDKRRLAMVCRLEIAADGSVKNYDFTPAVIQSEAKLSYNAVSELLEKQSGPILHEQPQLMGHLETLYSVSRALCDWRNTQALGMEDRPDFRLVLDEEFKVADIIRIDRNAAHRLVEECMLVTNRAAAEFLKEKGTGIFISQNGFRTERLGDVKRILKDLFGEDHKLAPKKYEDYKHIIRELPNIKTEQPVKSLFNRWLDRSHFSAQPDPHFAIGFEAYTTMTSPIRKYNDWLTHKLIKSVLSGEKQQAVDEKIIEHFQESQLLSRQASGNLEQWLICDYIRSKTDETFNATIIQVNNAGFIVRLDENGIEGFVDIRELNEKFEHDALYGRHYNDQHDYSMDSGVKVKLKDIDEKRLQITFELVEEK